MKTSLLTLLALFVSAIPALAQTANAMLNGLVRDSSGAIVPNVPVSVRNDQTNVTRQTVSNSEGRYVVSDLVPGMYTITASYLGFKRLERSGIALRVGDRVSIDLNLEVGAQTEQVSVTAMAPLLRVDDAQTGLVIDNRRIQELPQYNRNPLAFAQLTPNVNGTSDQGGYSGDFRINGGRTAQAEYVIDGIPVTTGYRHDVPPSVPSMEAIGEFKVITNGLSAEYGRLSGGVVTLVTRAGTNAYHGSLYEFFRNDKLNANDWNSNRFGRAKGVFHDNVFGGTFGGAVRIPKLYNGRDRTFFFLNYEGTRNRTGSNARLGSTPTDLERSGDFSRTLIDRGALAQIFDPLTASVENNRVVRQPFAGNRIPTSRINPIARQYLGFYPQPNQAPLPNSSHDNNFVGASTNPSNNNRWTGRLDENWSSRHATHFTITHFDFDSVSPRWFSALQTASVSRQQAYTISLDHTYTLTPTTLLNLRGGVVRSIIASNSEIDADTSSWAFQREITTLVGTTRNRAPSIGTGDTITALGGGAVNDARDTSYTASASVQKLLGRHTIKFGYEHRRYYSNVTTGGSFGMATQRSVTSQFFDTPTTGSGFASWLLGAVTGGSGTQLAGPASLQKYHGAYLQDDIKLTNKITVNLGMRWDFEPPRTERYDRNIFWDKSYKWNWNPNAGWNWADMNRLAGASMAQPEWMDKGIFGRVAIMGSKEYPGRTLQNSRPYQLAPRLGVAWQLMPRTVLRAGYGINWLTLTGSTFMNGAPWNVGYGDLARLIQGGSPDNGLTFPQTFNTPMPGGAGYIGLTRDIAELNRRVMGNWFIASDRNINPGHEHVFQLGLQREVGSGDKVWVFELNYSGNLGRSLPFWHGLGEHILPNAVHILGPLGNRLNTQVPNPFFGQVPANTGNGGRSISYGRLFTRHPLWNEVWTVGEGLGMSNYNAGYLQAEHRFAKGFGFLANYTISKLLNDVGAYDGQLMQGPGGQGFPQAGLPLSDIYGISNSDISQKLLFNYSWDVPVGRGRRFLASPSTLGAKLLDRAVGGWRLAGTTTFRTGFPILVFTPSGGVGGLGSQWYNIGHSRTARPRLVTPRVPYDNNVSGHAALEGAPNFTPYFNPDAFRLVRDFEIGDVGSTLPDMRGPGFQQWDLSVLKEFGLGAEQRRLQFRMEAQNLLNTMNPADPNGAVTQRTFGVITAQRGAPRRIMIALKLYF